MIATDTPEKEELEEKEKMKMAKKAKVVKKKVFEKQKTVFEEDSSDEDMGEVIMKDSSSEWEEDEESDECLKSGNDAVGGDFLIVKIPSKKRKFAMNFVAKVENGNPNGSSAHCPSSSWPDYTNSYAPYSPQTAYYDPHQDSAHGTPIHLPTVLPDPSSNEYISTSLTSPPPGTPQLYNSAKADLDSMIAPRYPENNTYCPNNWNPTTSYPPNNNYYNPSYNQQQYPHAMVVYPTSLYSTVNQNQIHFHLHATSEKNEQYLTDSVSLTPPSRVEIAQTATSEVPHGHVDPLRIEDSQRSQSQNDPSSVWRPY